MGQLNRGLEGHPAAEPTAPQAEAPQAQPHRPQAETPQARPGRPPLEAPQMGQLNRGPEGRPALEPPQMGQTQPALPQNPDAAVGQQAATAALGRPQRPPLEAPQLGQLNRPLTPPAGGPDTEDTGDDAPSGLPPRPQP